MDQAAGQSPILTDEQLAVVNHPIGQHARVLAVAGSGKTTTMAHRVQALVREQGVDPYKIAILMFNRLAREQFQQKLNAIGLPPGQQPDVNTFHSFSFGVIKQAIADGHIPRFKSIWTEDRAEQVRINTHRAIDDLQKRGDIPYLAVDAEEAMSAMSLWKGALIPPRHAGHHFNPYVPLVYKRFERTRAQKHVLTFDDFVPLAVELLRHNPAVRDRWLQRYDFVIVDEYQDVNYGQQLLVELLANRRADVMVVGDDDQTIYEWRGARPAYITHKFADVFDDRPAADYRLSRSFRFGAVIAQCAQNTISMNYSRVPKPVIAHFAHKPAEIHLVHSSGDDMAAANAELARQIKLLVRETGDPRQVVVLARMYSQMNGLEAEFLADKIPYRVVGRAPFFERREIKALVEYCQVAQALEKPITRTQIDRLLSIANIPNRMLSRSVLKKIMDLGRMMEETTGETLNDALDDPSTPLHYRPRERLRDLVGLLEGLSYKLTQEGETRAHKIFQWIIAWTDYMQHFENYYGPGEASEDRMRAVTSFVDYARRTQLGIVDFLAHLKELDTTLGAPEEHQILMTTIYRTKGLEYDYVFIPDCLEHYMPSLLGFHNPTYDTQQEIQEPSLSDELDAERRLFYVAITRARKAVYIGLPAPPDPNKDDEDGESYLTTASRFVEEMRLTATEAMLAPYQRLAARDPEARDPLLKGVAQHGGHRVITDNLIEHYLPPLNDPELQREVEKIVASEKPVEFAYTQPVDFITPLPPEPSQQKAWWESDD